MTTATKTVNFTPAQIALIQATADSVGTLSLANAETLAQDARMNVADGSPRKVRSIVAKISRMGLPYARKVATTKDGSAIEKKEAIVAEIAKFVKGNLDGLATAPKPSLVAVRDALAALAA